MNKRILRLASLVILSGLFIVTLGNGCGKDFKIQDGTIRLDSGTSDSASSTDEDGEIINPNTKTVSLVSSNQTLSHLSTCLGVKTPSAETVALYEAKKGAISVSGAAKTVTPPMMMAITNIAGEICNDLINQEVASGERMFVGINMSANQLPSSSDLQNAISRLALSCWNRYETSDEKQVLLDLVSSSVSPTENMASRKASLLLCTSVASSLDALMN